MANEHVGINVKEGQALSPVIGAVTNVSAIVGIFERGPVDKARFVTDMASFERIYGSAPLTQSKAYYAVKSFFKKAGSAPLYIVRVGDSSALAASVILDDQQGTPADTLKIEAVSEGTWGNNTGVDVDAYNKLDTTLAAQVDVDDTSAQLTSVDGVEVGSYIHLHDGANDEYITVTQVDAATKTIHWSGGVSNTYTVATATVKSLEFTLKVYWKGVLVETWTGLSMNDNVSFFCEKVVNDVSNYIKCTDQKSSDTDYQDNPVATSVVQALTSGNDGLSAIASTDYSGSESSKTGVYALDAIENLFRFACPDPYIQGGTEADVITVHQAMLDYAYDRGDVEFYADVPSGKIPSAAVTYAGNFAGRHMAIFYPHLTVVEGGKTITFPASCAVMGAAVVKDYNIGPYKNVGNEQLAYATDVARAVSVAEGETLNDAKINTVRKFVGKGIRVYGGRTLSAVTQWLFLHYSEYYNYISRTLKSNLSDMVFQPNNQFTWKVAVRKVRNFFERELAIGAVSDYEVIMDSTTNTQDQIASGIATMKVAYVPAGTMEKVVIELTSSPSGIIIS